MKSIARAALARQILPFILFSFLEGFVLVYPVYMIMLEAWGLDFLQLSLILSIWAIPVVILELPSSMLADRWSKRKLLSLGMALKAIGYSVWIAFPGFIGASVGFVLWGCQEAFCSGTRQALLYERLAALGLEDEYEAAAGICGAAGSLAVAAAMILGGLLYSASPLLVIILSIASSLAAAAVALGFEDAPRAARAGAAGPGLAAILASLRSSIRAPGIAAVIAVAAVTGSIYGTVEEYDGLWYKERFGLPIAFVGFWSSLRFGAEALGGLAAGRIARILDRAGRCGIAAAIALGGAAFAAAALLPGFIGAAPYLAYYIVMALLAILIEGRLQAYAEDESRATLLSSSNMLMTICAICVSPALGAIAEGGGLAAAFLVSAVATIASAPLALIGIPRRGKASAGATRSDAPPADAAPSGPALEQASEKAP